MPRKRDADAGPSPAQVRKDNLAAIAAAYDGEDTVHVLFRKAVELDAEKRDVQARIAANRRSLRDLAVQGIASQQDVDVLYTRGSDNGDAA